MRSKRMWWGLVGLCAAVVVGAFILQSRATGVRWPLGYPVIVPSTRPTSTAAARPTLAPLPVKITVSDYIDRASKLMRLALPFERIRLGPRVRTIYYRPAWHPDDFFISTQTGRIFVTYWPPLPPQASRTPEYVGILSQGKLTPIKMPRPAYYSVGIDNYAGPIPILSGFPLEGGLTDHFGILLNGSIVPSSQIPAQLRGYDLHWNPLRLCVQGSLASGVALYAVEPNGALTPILSYAAWREATHGLWGDQRLGCTARFAGEYYVGLGYSEASTLFRISHGRALMVGAARIRASTDNVMVLQSPGGAALIEAYWP